ncbi:MAG: MBL fold metallo-hydrolase [Cellvibrionaceae bacterium]|nr:MBL fold metallo-hydrolase [Cellvibrionaceae bacterium]MCV6624683.1 MBL fold metallo-hydrolase [Cellvibrionaceae bacterium]
MTKPTEHLGYGIYLIDTGMGRPGLAACYLIVHQGEAAIIETGTLKCVPQIMNAIGELGLSPEQLRYVIPTHVHLDHAGGAGGLMAELPNAQLIIHPRGARHMIEPAKLKAGTVAVYGEEMFAAVYGDLLAIDEARVIVAEDGHEFYLAERKFQCFDTPGHARHHLVVHDPLSQGIFSGDTFGVSYPELNGAGGERFIFPPSTPVHFDPDAWVTTIERLLTLEPKRFYLTHYGMVENPAPLASSLIEQINCYANIARNAANEPDPSAAINKALEHDTQARLNAINCPMPFEQRRELLTLDNQINAQGLAFWLSTLR